VLFPVPPFRFAIVVTRMPEIVWHGEPRRSTPEYMDCYLLTGREDTKIARRIAPGQPPKASRKYRTVRGVRWSFHLGARLVLQPEFVMFG
jgi:hypothetical protein